MRLCSRCKQPGEFYRKGKGYQSKCKDCNDEVTRAYVEKNRKAINAYMKARNQKKRALLAIDRRKEAGKAIPDHFFIDAEIDPLKEKRKASLHPVSE